MATLPDINGQRPVARPVRTPARASPVAAALVGGATRELGEGLSRVGEVIHEREAVTLATERDTLVSDEIRDLIYNPETGFAGLKGQAAVNARPDIMAKLEDVKSRAYEGLNNTAKRKLEGTLNRRIEGALGTVERQVLQERDNWLAGASAARVEAAYQDSLFNPADTAASLRVIENETRAEGLREGWGAEVTESTIRARRSKLFTDQVTRIASADPIAAMEYMRNNQDRMTASDVANIEIKLQPEVKQATGRAMGREAFTGTGNLSAAYEVAADTIGMDENAQRHALQAYLADGGSNLDPATTAWCAAFINSTLAQSGMKGTGSNMARSFLDWGEEVTNPKRGDVVVLSRGEPPYGHVGFYDGENPDGTIRLLGGNQNDKVGVSSYDKSRVLGIRRVVNPDEGSVAKGMSALVNIQDPIERDAAIEEYNLRAAVTEGQRKATLAAAQDTVFQHLESGGTIDALDLETRQAIGQKAMTSLRAYEKTLAAGETVKTDNATYYDLRQMQANDEDGWRGLNLMEYRHNLSDADLRKFIDEQKTPVSEVKRTATSTLMSMATRHIADAGIDSKSDEGKTVSSDLQSRLLRWQDGFIAENKRAPSDVEIDDQIKRELVPVVIKGPNWTGDNQSTAAVSINYNGESVMPDDDMTLEEFANSRLEINNTEVSEQSKLLTIELLATQLGREVTPQDVVSYLIREKLY